MVWPSYFLIIFLVTLLLVGLVYLQRRFLPVICEKPLSPHQVGPVSTRQSVVGLGLLYLAGAGLVLVITRSLLSQQLPGWDLVLTWFIFVLASALRSIPLDRVAAFWQANAELGLALCLAQFALIGVLASYYSAANLVYFAWLGLFFALLNLWRFRGRIPRIYWVMSLALVVYSYDLNAWWTATIGDDLNFHEIAWLLSEKVTFAELGQYLFNAGGAHGAHTFLSSFLQAVSMKLFGHGSFGWRFSSLYLLAWGLVFYYYFLKSFLDEQVAFLTVALLAFSVYIIDFGKIGYNNLQALFALWLALAATTWALRSKTELSFAVLGTALALCLYVYPVALYVLPLPFLLLAWYEFPVSWPVIKRWALMSAVPLALSFPLFLQPVYWDTKQQGTFLNQPELLQWPLLAFHFGSNLLYALYSFLYSHEQSHFLVYSHVDPVSAAFLLIGFALLLSQARRQRFAIFMLLTYLYFVFFVGASHDRLTPSNTRMFMLLPWYALFTTWGLRWVTGRLFGSRPAISVIAQFILVVVIAGANLYQGYDQAYRRYASEHYIETLFLRINDSIYQAEPEKPKNYFFLLDADWSEMGLRNYQYIYPSMAWAQFYSLTLEAPQLPVTHQALLAERETIIIISPFLNPQHADWPQLLGLQLEQLGKVRCDVFTPDGLNFRFYLYHSPDLPQACPPTAKTPQN